MLTSGARVLIVDDDAASRRLLEARLRPLACDVATAGNGEQALSAIRKDLPDLVLLDLQMPKMGGIEVLRVNRLGDEVGGSLLHRLDRSFHRAMRGDDYHRNVDRFLL